jgi:hypothetical protein
VTKGRQRVKQYDNTIYLKNGDEFEIELFNPTTNKVLAKINLNGKSLGSGIILRPGERVYLERYFDEARKFLFETYEVNAADPNALEAIKMNGIVEVEFYEEPKSLPPINWEWYNYPYNYPYTQPSIFYCNTSGTTAKGNSVTTKGTTGNATFTCSCNNPVAGAHNLVDNVENFDANVENFSRDFAPMMDLEETGRIEKGSISDQSFLYDSTTFNTFYTWKTTWKILPESQKLMMKEDLNIYCSNCGAKRKKASHKFCSNCGNKF